MDYETRDRSIDAAAHWYARLQSPQCTTEDFREFEAWCDRDPANARAFAAARRLAEDLFETIAADERLGAMADDALAMGAAEVPAGGSLLRRGDASQPVAAASRRRRKWSLAAAASVAIVAIAGFVWNAGDDTRAPARFMADDAQRDVMLDDGSFVRLDVHSAIEVRYTSRRRELVLEAGRAIFDVAKDPGRPFTVATSLGVVTAVGTKFEVRQNDVFTVTLAEGVITVTDPVAQRSERLDPGEQLTITPEQADWIKHSVDVDATLGWSIGRLTFRDEQLPAVLEEVNRYASTKLRIADPSLAQLTISGSFVSGDTQSVAAAFAAVLPIRVTDGGEELLLFRRWEPPARP